MHLRFGQKLLGLTLKVNDTKSLVMKSSPGLEKVHSKSVYMNEGYVNKF